MEPPTELSDDGAEEPAPETLSSSSITEDEEVAEWVNKQLQLKAEGRLHISEKPALHAVALDKVGTGPSEKDPHAPSQND
jgi:mitogen-activated protein kinase kinase